MHQNRHRFSAIYVSCCGTQKGTGLKNCRTTFCLICDEIADVTFSESFEKLQQIWENLLCELKLPEEKIDLLFQSFRASLPSEIAAMMDLVPNHRVSA